MRTLALVAAVSLASASAALPSSGMAAPASISVTVGPELQLKAVNSLGQRDVDDLVKSLQTAVEKRLAKTGAYDGAHIDLVLVDAEPNRPTFKQLGDTPGLSLRSFGIGGARIEGRAVAADGVVTPLRYSYYSPDIRWASSKAIWSDADWAIDTFADQLSRGSAIASR